MVETVRTLCGEPGLLPHIPFPPQKPRLDLDVASPGVGIQVTVTKGHPARTFHQAAVLVAPVTKPAHKEFADSDLGDFLDDIFGKGVMSGCQPRWGILLGDALATEIISIPLTPDSLPPHRACLLPAD